MKPAIVSRVVGKAFAIRISRLAKVAESTPLGAGRTAGLIPDASTAISQATTTIAAAMTGKVVLRAVRASMERCSRRTLAA
jgi:hypothetical protein